MREWRVREWSTYHELRNKARQSCKIREIGDTLVSLGFLTLDEQAAALGLSRSTTWTIHKANHKVSGLSAAIINRMLTSPQLPPPARAKILEYVQEKAGGWAGASRVPRWAVAHRRPATHEDADGGDERAGVHVTHDVSAKASSQ